MKQLLLLTVFMLLLAIAGISQGFSMQLSPAFTEPAAMDSKVFQCENGNTLLFSFFKKEGIAVKVFDKSRQLKNTVTIKAGSWKADLMPRSRIAAIFEVKGKLLMFMEQSNAKIPRLYRLIFDSNTGEIISDENIAEMPKYGSLAGYAMYFGNVEPKGFFVVKDKASDHYAVVYFDGFASKTDRRIELVHYNGNNEEINRGFYTSPEEAYKYINYLDMFVDGDKQVVIATYAFNTGDDAGSRVFISRLIKGSTQMEHQPLKKTTDFNATKGVLEYNRMLQKLELLTVSYVNKEGSTHYYKVLLHAIDPVTLKVTSSNVVNTAKIMEYSKANYKGEQPSKGMMPMTMHINPDQTTTIVWEELTTVTNISTSNTGMTRSSNRYLLKDVGVLDIDKEMQPSYGYSVRKSQGTMYEIPSLSLHEKSNNSVSFDADMNMFGLGAMNTKSGFFSSDFITGVAGGRYIIYNDSPANYDLDLASEPKNVIAISDCNTVCYRMNNGVMEKSLLFGQPGNGFDNRFALLSSSQFQNSTNTYAVMMIEKASKVKQAYIAWIKF